MNRKAMAELRARLLAKKTADDDRKFIDNVGVSQQAIHTALTTTATSPILETTKETEHMNEPKRDEYMEGIMNKGSDQASNELMTSLAAAEEDEKVSCAVEGGSVQVVEEKNRPRRKRHYVGKTSSGVFELVYADLNTPGDFAACETTEKYGTVLGPFRVKASAIYYLDNLTTNPYVRCVADAERLYRESKKQ